MFRSFTLTVSAPLVLLSLPVIPAARASSIVAPGKYSSTEAGFNYTIPFGPGNGYFGSQTSLRWQQVYDSSLFSGPIDIFQIAFRYDGNVLPGVVASSPIPDIEFNLSTTSRSVSGLSNTFSQNVGLDDLEVFRGALTFTSQNVGSPRPLDLIVTFQRGFLYDPSQGNLLLDVRNFSGWVYNGGNIIPAIDGFNYSFGCCGITPGPPDSGPRIARMVAGATGVGDTTGVLIDGGVVTEFIGTPEPATVWLSLAGLGFVCSARRRRPFARPRQGR